MVRNVEISTRTGTLYLSALASLCGRTKHWQFPWVDWPNKKSQALMPRSQGQLDGSQCSKKYLPSRTIVQSFSEIVLTIYSIVLLTGSSEKYRSVAGPLLQKKSRTV